jgi:hypothetical protein
VTVERHGNKEKKKLDTEPKEADIVRLIFQLYLFGDGRTGSLGIKDITHVLSECPWLHRAQRQAVPHAVRPQDIQEQDHKDIAVLRTLRTADASHAGNVTMGFAADIILKTNVIALRV